MKVTTPLSPGVLNLGLCSQGGACAIGDVGPGGGLVFYIAPSKQPWGQILEVAPQNWSGGASDPTAAWCSGGSNPGTTFISGTKTGIGTGLNNSRIIGNGCSGGAATDARGYTGNGFTDWYLPSSEELTQLYNSNVVSLSGTNYWS